MTAEQQAPEVRLGDDGSLDEVVGPGFHLEQMDTNHWWLRIESAGVSVAVWLHARGKITASYERLPHTSPTAPPAP